MDKEKVRADAASVGTHLLFVHIRRQKRFPSVSLRHNSEFIADL